jgi:hypothetical protein
LGKKNKHADADQICADNGGRLCTLGELQSQVANVAGNECKYNNKKVWTSTTCTTNHKKPKAGYFVAKKKDGGKPKCKPTTGKKSTATIVCCGDTVETAYLINADSGADSSIEQVLDFDPNFLWFSNSSGSRSGSGWSGFKSGAGLLDTDSSKSQGEKEANVTAVIPNASKSNAGATTAIVLSVLIIALLILFATLRQRQVTQHKLVSAMANADASIQQHDAAHAASVHRTNNPTYIGEGGAVVVVDIPPTNAGMDLTHSGRKFDTVTVDAEFNVRCSFFLLRCP